MFGNSPFVSGFWCRFHHTLTSRGYLALSQGFSCERRHHVSCDWLGTGRVWGCRRLACGCQGGLHRKLFGTPREMFFVSSQPFVFDRDCFSLSDLDLNEPGMVPKVQFTPRGLRGYAREHDRWFRGSFVSEWRARYSIHAYQRVEWQTGCMMLLDSWVSEQTNKIDQQLLKIVW